MQLAAATASVSSNGVHHLRLLGRFRLEHRHGAIEIAATGQRLLALLALRGSTQRTVVAGTLWPEVTEDRAQGSLRTTLWRLSRDAGNLIESSADTLALAPALSVDVQAFTIAALRIVGSGEAVADDGQQLDGGGELLPGWDDEWVTFERERLRQLRLHALEALVQRLIERSRFALALEAALESARIEPLRESAHRAIVAVHLAEGNLVEAIRHYEMVHRTMREELGVAPSEEFTRMLPLACTHPAVTRRRGTPRR